MTPRALDARRSRVLGPRRDARRRLRREAGEHAAATPSRSTLALDFYVNPDHAGIYTALDRGYFDEAGLEVEPAGALRPVGADPRGRRRARRPRDLLRARGAARPGPGPAGDRGRGARPAAADLADLAARGRDHDVRRPRAARRSPPPGSRTRRTSSTRSSSAPGSTADDVTQSDVGLNLLPAVLSGSADAMLGGFLNVEGVDLRQRGEHPRVVPVDRLGIPTYDELVLVADSTASPTTRSRSALFIAALERGTRAAARDPAGRDRGDPRRRRRPRPEADPRRDRRDAAAAARRRSRAAVRLHGRARVGAVRRLLRRPRPDLDPAAAAEMLTDDLLPGRVP